MALLDNRAPSRFRTLLTGVQQRLLPLMRFLIIILILFVILLRSGWHSSKMPGSSLLLQINSSITSSVMEVQSFVVGWYELVANYCATQSRLAVENAQLREDLSKVVYIEEQFLNLEVENKHLRDALKYHTNTPQLKLSSKLVFTSPYDSYAGAYLAAGSKSGVQKGQFILNNKVLLGRVEGVGTNFASILLISDINSKVPVYLADSKQRAILAGRLSEYLELIYLDDINQVTLGELVLTSGDGQYYPADILVARVESVRGGKVLAKMLISPSIAARVGVFEAPDISR